MKRTITSVLGALAVVTGLGAVATSAQAQTSYEIECDTPVPLSLTTYPYKGPAPDFINHAWICRNVVLNQSATVQRGSAMAGSIRDLHGAIGPARDAYDKLRDAVIPRINNGSGNPPPAYQFPAQGITFFIFRNAYDHAKYFSERHIPYTAIPTTQPFEVGQTVAESTGPTIYSAILEVGSTGIPITEYFSVQWTTTHEAGHTLDYAYRAVSQSTTATHLSASFMYADLLARDKRNLDLNIVKACGLGGIFNGRTVLKDPPSPPEWICTGLNHNEALAPQFAGKKNSEILNLVTKNLLATNRELFANQVAKVAGHETGGTFGFSGYIDLFPCTLQLVRTVINTGIVPNRATMQAVTRPGDDRRAGCPVRNAGHGWALPTN